MHQHRVEILQEPNLLRPLKSSNEPTPIIKICSEISSGHSANKTMECIPTTSGNLAEPTFQSSMMLLKNLESFEKMQVDSNNLLQCNLLKDEKMRKFVDKEVSKFNKSLNKIALLLWH